MTLLMTKEQEDVNNSALGLDQLKRDTLLDLIRRVIANPGNAVRVADAIARDWSPTIHVDGRGNTSLVIEGQL